MPDELDLVRAFRSDIAGPSTDAWVRARAAVAEVSGNARYRVENTRRTRRRWPLTIGAVAAASGTATIVSVLVLGGSQVAFAGWRATPATATATQTAATQDNCQGYLPALPGSSGQGSWSEVGSDVRGPYAMAVYENGTTLASCFTGPSFATVQAESLTASRGGMVSASGSGPPIAPTSNELLLSGGDIDQLLISHLSQTQNGPYTLAEGRVESTVSAVTLVLSDGQEVSASTGRGWLVAWWPGSEGVTGAQTTSGDGKTTVSLNQMPIPTPPSVPSNGSPPAVRLSP